MASLVIVLERKSYRVNLGSIHIFRNGSGQLSIACRICTFTDALSKEYPKRVRTRDTIRNHQTTTQQFFQPGIMWAGFNKNYYVTTNEM